MLTRSYASGRLRSRLLGGAAIIFIALLWEVLSRLSLINTNVIPPLSSVIETIFKGITQGRLLSDALHSLRRVGVGFGFSAVLALSLGILAALSRNIGDVIRPVVDLVRPIPPIAWIPIALLWFGFGDPPAYFLVGLGAFFPIFTNTFLGVSMVDQETVEVARCHGASRELLFREVILPQALPLIFAGLRTGLGVAWMVVITAELVGAQSGLGYLIQISRAQLQAEQVVAGMVVIGLIGYGVNRMMIAFGRRVMPWRERGKSLLAEE